LIFAPDVVLGQGVSVRLTVDQTIVALAGTLKRSEMLTRLDYYRKGGLPGGSNGEQVSKTRSLPMPAFDRVDREIQQDQRTYNDCLDDAYRLLSTAVALQVKYLEVLTLEDAQRLVSDDGTCLYGCVRRNMKTRWYIARGLCPAHYMKWKRAGCPELPPAEVLRDVPV
jgi:hypothetical protein